jgi:hypothetical protein
LRYRVIMKRYDSVREFLTTLPPEERKDVKWSIDALMVQYWEVLNMESEDGKDNGGIIVPIGDRYLSISLGLKWHKLKLLASVQEVKLLDDYELVSRKDNNQRPNGMY